MHEIRSHSQSSKVVRLNPILIKNFRPTRSHVFWWCRSALQSLATVPEKESRDMQLSNLPCPSRRNYSWYAIAVVSSYSNYSNWIMWRLCMWCSAPCRTPAHISSKGPEVVRVRNVSVMITGAFILIHLGEPAVEKYIVSSWNVVRKGARLK